MPPFNNLFTSWGLKLFASGAIAPKTKMRFPINLAVRRFQHEVFAALFLDSKHRIIKFEELFAGKIDLVSVHTREVVKRAGDVKDLQMSRRSWTTESDHHNAAAVIFAHNHPSGVTDPNPSHADTSLTERLVATMDLIGVRTLDHIIVANNQSQSLAELGHV